MRKIKIAFLIALAGMFAFAGHAHGQTMDVWYWSVRTEIGDIGVNFLRNHAARYHYDVSTYHTSGVVNMVPQRVLNIPRNATRQQVINSIRNHHPHLLCLDAHIMFVVWWDDLMVIREICNAGDFYFVLNRRR